MKKVYQCLSVFLITIITVGVFLIGCGGGGASSGGNNNNCKADGASCGHDNECCSKWCYFTGGTLGYRCTR
jgi:hypothetical protein